MNENETPNEGAARPAVPSTDWFGGWVEARETLPEVSQEVLTYGRYGYVIGSLDAEGKWNAKDTDNETGEPWLRDNDTVTHWRPLPQSPNAPSSATAATKRPD